ncbi:hypothetical protein AVEN_207126-1 [Araneus ventricosus]|uniref:Uncharacterized protein n=1 Tax=Araneus ventricosus TaxID=182803 RepID=A0A4Y2M5V2_ARAVE|nr:hypothetical protein AVEN_207126-1 [Araneus ventricosus]
MPRRQKFPTLFERYRRFRDGYLLQGMRLADINAVVQTFRERASIQPKAFLKRALRCFKNVGKKVLTPEEGSFGYDAEFFLFACVQDASMIDRRMVEMKEIRFSLQMGS